MIVEGSAFVQGRVCIVGDIGYLVVLVCALEKEATEDAHAWCGHDRGRDALQLTSGRFDQIDHVVVVLEVVGQGVATTISALAKTVELDLLLMIYNMGILVASYSVDLLIDRVDQAKGVSGRIEGIEVGPFLDLVLKFLIEAPQDGGDNIM